MKSWKVWLLVAVIFLSGAASGAFLMRAYMSRHLPEMLARPMGHFEDRILSHLDSEVGLSDSQRAELRPIIKESIERVGAVQQTVRAEMEANLRQMDDAIAARLDSEQKIKFAVLRERVEKFRRSMPPGLPPPPPGTMPFGPPPGPPPQ
jgi:hypothetical protein